MRTVVTPARTCPYCGYKMDRASLGLGLAREPTPGDLMLCIECHGLAILTEDFRHRAMTAEDRAAVAPAMRKALEQAVAALIEIKKSAPSRPS